VCGLIAVTALKYSMAVAMITKRYPDLPGLAIGIAISASPEDPRAGCSQHPSFPMGGDAA